MEKRQEKNSISPDSEQSSRWLIALASMSLAGLLVWLTRDQVFFWDTIQLSSKQADWFYQNRFRYILLPERIDSGHPPGFGAYLAVWWTLLGRTLPVSHLAMFPWLGLFFYQLIRLSRELLPEKGYWLSLFALANAVWWGQAVLVSPDVVLAALFLTGIRAQWHERQGLLTVVVIAFSLLSLRAMFIGVVLYLWHGVERWREGDRRWAPYLQSLLPYLPGGLVGLAFLVYHYQQTGWIGYHADSPWAPAFVRSDGYTLLRNAVILAWRLVDYGHFFAWGAIAIVLWRYPASRRDPVLWRFGLLAGLLLIVLGIPVLSHQGLLNHRYFLPIYLSIDLLAGYLLLSYACRALYWLCWAGLLSGNLWHYPEAVAQGWDATPAHLPYYGVRTEMIARIESRGISPDSVGTAFPERGPFDDRDLSGNEAGFHAYRLGRDPYIFWAEVMNDLDHDLPELRRRYRPVETMRRGGIEAVLYERID